MKKPIFKTAEQRKKAVTALVILAVGGIYFLIMKFTDFSIGCPIRRVTGIVCPGCGISHFFLDLGSLDIKSAVRENYLLDLLIIIWTPIIILRKTKAPPLLRVNGRFDKILTWICLVITIIFTVLRNMPQFKFLLPLYMQG
ncbi:MAG: DUF2752 domain-containing protein [Oscillospiraceae bacterium]